jgi:hypothetical protein
MPEMTNKEAAEVLDLLRSGLFADGGCPGVVLEALRLAVGALLRPRYCGECEFGSGGCWRNPHGVANQPACDEFKRRGKP